MKISFVIPAYNEEKIIAQCLASVIKELNEKKYDAEIIVVNNASTDRTKEIAMAFNGVKVIDEPKKGLSRARHAGFIASSGELIANIDADTIIPSGWIEIVLKEFNKNKKMVGLSGPYIYHDLPSHTRALVKFFYLGGYISHLINHHILNVGAVLQGGNFVLKRSALEKIGGYDTSIEFYGEDTEIARRISKVGRVKFTFKLKMRTSGRRLKKEGVITTGARYIINYFWTIFLKKPLTKKYIDVRE